MQVWTLFWVQMVLITISAFGQIPATFYSKVGVNVSWFGFWFLFSVINFHLCFSAWKKESQTSLLLSSIIHVTWAVVALVNICVSIISENYFVDTLIILLISISCILTYWIARKFYGVGLEEPIVRGVFSLLCRVVPHLTLCYFMIVNHGTSISVHMLITGHFTILIRLWILRKNLNNRDAYASFVADTANEISWIITTAVWLSL